MGSKNGPRNAKHDAEFVSWFRSVAPYANAFRGRTFVVAFGGQVVADRGFVEFVHDLNLLASLGVRLVLVHGARPQIEARLKLGGVRTRYVRGLRVTPREALECVKEAVGRARSEVEAVLSLGLPNSPMANADIRVASGNFVTARPVGVVNGVDLVYGGEVRKIDVPALRARLDQGDVVLLSPLGYSPTGEIFNLTYEEVATASAVALEADKLIFLTDSPGITGRGGRLERELTAGEAGRLLDRGGLAPGEASFLRHAVAACRDGVGRVHLIGRHLKGAVLLELFTREGVGTMVTREAVERLRCAGIEDVGGILKLIQPLEEEGVLVKRSRELLEREIGRFVVLEHDREIVGCAALYPFPEKKAGELACLAVHPECRDRGYGERLLAEIEVQARRARLRQLFVLTTRAEHWFVERGFKEVSVSELPEAKQALYNYQRRSIVLLKRLSPKR
jgi:amino-acid N-acetyltransferase